LGSGASTRITLITIEEVARDVRVVAQKPLSHPSKLEFVMLWCVRFKRIQHTANPYSHHEGANYVKQAVFSNLYSHMTGESIIAEVAMTLAVTLTRGVLPSPVRFDCEGNSCIFYAGFGPTIPFD